MDNFTNFELSIIEHVLFKYASYLKTFKYPYPSVLRPEGVEQLALKINELKIQRSAE